MILETLIFALGFNILMFLPAYFFQTDKLTDFSYALSFIALAFYLFITSSKTLGDLLLFITILLWAIRLGSFLVIRIHAQGKDVRFDEMRKHFFKFLGFWLLQGITVWIVLIPAILFEGNFLLFGLLIWLIGFCIESVADYQKFMFKKISSSFITTGLWKYSRHPNYFGEILCWVGIYIFSSQWLYGLISPLYIALLLIFVSGIPLLEEKADKSWGKTKAYQNYKKKTSVLIPWFTRH